MKGWAHNNCRNIFGNEQQPWCFVSPKDHEKCSIPQCPIEKPNNEMENRPIILVQIKIDIKLSSRISSNNRKILLSTSIHQNFRLSAAKLISSMAMNLGGEELLVGSWLKPENTRGKCVISTTFIFALINQ